MKTLNEQAFEEIRRWVYKNARPLELALWQYHFEKGSKEEVLSILSCYQNEDGGFGGTIEPDSWNPDSTPYNAQFVMRILRSIEFYDMTHPIYQGMFRYLENTENKADYGWSFTVPTNDHYPHAIWWNYSEKENLIQSFGLTAYLVGFILRYGDKQSKLYQISTEYSYKVFDKLMSDENLGDMGVGGVCYLIEDIKKAGITENYDFKNICEKVREQVRNKIQKEKDNFMANPLEFIHSPNSCFYEEHHKEIESALDRIIDERPSAGVWGIPWEWYNGNKYPEAFAISENWWKSFEAIEKLLKLERFGRFTK